MFVISLVSKILQRHSKCFLFFGTVSAVKENKTKPNPNQ